MRNHFIIFFTFLSLIFGTFNSACAINDSDGGKLAETLCNVVKAMTGTIGKSIASIAIIALAIGLFMGKLSWGLALATALGIGMIFGASSVVGWLSGSSAVDCS